MADKQNFRVVREHQGDRFYLEGEIREAVPGEVKHLVPHVLEPVKAKAARAAPANKAKGPAPANKAEGAAPADKTPAKPAEPPKDPAEAEPTPGATDAPQTGD